MAHKNPTSEEFAKCEAFMARVYNSNKNTLNEVRESVLLARNKPKSALRTVPATSNPAKFHICRTFFQAAKLLYPDITSHQDDLPSSVDSGGHRMEGDQLVPIMMTLEWTYLCIDEAVSCDCKS